MLTVILEFLVWTLMLYLIHRMVHVVPVFKEIHNGHHKYIAYNKTKWQWVNLFLYTDNFISTLDIWIMEVIPTFIFCFITGQWWLMIFYYCWAAFFQDRIEHDESINWYPLTAGQWHLKHHRNPKKNFGMFIPIWDKLFKTEI